jgi:hypothetical protein
MHRPGRMIVAGAATMLFAASLLCRGAPGAIIGGMPFRLPLITFVRCRRVADAPDFARAAGELLPAGPDLRWRATKAGLEILAADEDVMESALRTLRELHGDGIESDGVAVRTLAGDPAREPVMAIRISTRREFADAIRAELRRRGAALAERSGASRASTMIAGTAPMAKLLGLPAVLAVLSRGNAVHWIRLSHYAPRR